MAIFCKHVWRAELICWGMKWIKLCERCGKTKPLTPWERKYEFRVV